MKYIKEQLKNHKGKITWMASYPKSGNTWFRCFLAALLNGVVDLKQIKAGDAGTIYSSRSIFDDVYEIDSRLFSDEEALRYMPAMIKAVAKSSPELSFMKIHDAYFKNKQRKPIIPIDVTHKVVYLVRNPLDVVASFANHKNSTKDEAIAHMNNPRGYLGKGKFDGFNIAQQFSQRMYSWSGHVSSWIDQKEVEVILVRYEDKIADPFKSFSRIMKGLEIECSDTAIKKAIRLSSFKKLKKAESEKGFREKPINTENFFRKGKSNQYHKELNEEQIQSIIKHHKKMMKRLGYLD